MRHNKRHLRRRHLKYAGLTLAVLLAGLLSYAVIRTTQAASFTLPVEAETGTVAGNARTSSLTGTSGGQVVAFGQTSAGTTCKPPASNPVLLDQDPQEEPIKPWRRTGPELVIYFNIASMSSEYAGYFQQGVADWSASECIDARTATSCPSGSVCVPVSMSNENDGDTLGVYYWTENSSYMLSGSMTLYSPILSGSDAKERLATVVHEMGHAVSQSHRATSTALMYWSSAPNQSLKPDTTDMHNVRVIYGAAAATQAEDVGPVVNKSIKTTVDDLRR